MQRPLPSDPLINATHVNRGLLQSEVDDQLVRYGPNNIIAVESSSWLSLVADTLRDPMVWFLAFTSLLFALTGDYLEAGVLALALLPILGMDAFLHRRTQISTAALSKRLSSTATVLRDGQTSQVKSVDLVPGDVVLVKENEFVPADAIFISGQGLQLDESALTGEAMPVKKSSLVNFAANAQDRLVDAEHWANAGTRMLTGSAKLLVAYTGQDTHYGEIVRLAQAGAHERTPLQQAMMSLTKTLLLAAVVFCVALAATRLAQGHGWVDAIVSAVTLAIAALPEEFPVVFSFFLGVGVYRLAQHQALVRRAVVVENIGRVTCICSDKTGTLTEGRLVLAHQACADGVSEDALMLVAATASRHESKDPLDIALLDMAAKPSVQVLATFPFSEGRRRETAVVKRADKEIVACVKGAPETVLQMCDLDNQQMQAWQDKAHEFASTGHKVIGFAEQITLSDDWAQLEGASEAQVIEEPASGYRFMGLIAFEDPVRDGARQAVETAQAAGIRVIMVTGDHAATAAAIAAELGIGGSRSPRVVLGDQLKAVNLSNVDVVARATPAQKLELVNALRQQGEIVAVTGDGVNDAPALKGADIGIAMGERGTQAAREVAPIVLLDDNFRTIVRAIAEGRQLFANLQSSFAYLLMVHLPLVITAAWIPLAGYPLLYLPIHIVWLELIIHPTALLGFQRKVGDTRLASMGARREVAGFFNGKQWGVIVLVGLAVTITMIVTYERSLSEAGDVAHARTMAMALLIASSIAVTWGLGACQTRTAIVIAVVVSIVSLVFFQWMPVASLLHLKPLHWDDWLIVLACAIFTGILARGFMLSGYDKPVS